jgi:hypothetical protein
VLLSVVIFFDVKYPMIKRDLWGLANRVFKKRKNPQKIDRVK